MSAQTPDDTELPARDVVQALARVGRDLPGIGRDQRALDEHGGYAYRGIDQITSYAAPLLARHGVVFIPQVQRIEIREHTVHGTIWTDTILTVRYRICGPGGSDDYVDAVVIGIGRDNADKGANKALTQAYKYALIQTLCVADSRDDADGHTWQASANKRASRQAIAQLTERIELLPSEVAAPFRAWKLEQNYEWPWTQAAIDAMHRRLDEPNAAGAI
jgi:hypothetical protein